MVIYGAPCPNCASEGPHDITDIEKTIDGFHKTYTIRCTQCEDIWDEHYRNPWAEKSERVRNAWLN